MQPKQDTITTKMKAIHILLALLLTLMLTFSCKKGQADHNTDDTTDSTLIADATSPTEEEIGDIMDTAKQEKPAEIREELRGLHIYVSKTTMHLYVLNANDSVVFTCGIACGLRRGDKKEKGDYKTPEGNFHISGMFNSTDWIHHTKDGRDVKGCYGPHFLRLSTGRFGGIGIHGTNAPRSIGHRASEGCIRVNSENIIVLFKNYAYNGMPVVVSAENEPLPAFKGLALPEEKEEKTEKKDTIKHDIEHSESHRENATHREDAHPSDAPRREVKHYDIDSLFD